MSYFCNGIIYVVVPTEQISNEMVNAMKISFNGKKNTLRTNNDGTKTIFKIKTSGSSSFVGYSWLNCNEIEEKLNDAEWNYGEV